MVRALTHPRMMGGLKNFYPQVCTIQVNTPARDELGHPEDSWADKAELVGLACRLAPATGKERRTDKETYLMSTHTIVLQGHFEQITEEMRAVIDGLHYNILQVRHDAQAASTSLDCEIVR